MGTKGEKLTNNSILAANTLEGKLKSIGDITSKKMFGGHGIFHSGKMFCIVDSKGKSFLKLNEANKLDFEKKGSEQHSKMPYYSIPDDVLNNNKMLLSWVKKSIASL